MKKPLAILIGVGFAAGVFGAVLLTSFLSDHFLKNQAAAAKPVIAACPTTKTAHQVSIVHDSMVPAQTAAKLCDTLTITNNDTTIMLVAFGPHDDHQPYDGVTEKELERGQSFTVTLNQLGSFHFHDHLQDVAQGDFTVTK